MPDDTAAGQELVRESLARAFPGSAAPRLKLLAGGAMHQWWSATIPGGEPGRVVIRMSPPDRDDVLKARNEVAILTEMHGRGIRVPFPVMAAENSIDQTFLVLEEVEGDTTPRQLVADESHAGVRRQLLLDLAQDLAAVHGVLAADVPGADLRGPAPGEDPLLYEIQYQLEEYDRVKMNPHPAVEWGLRWCRREAEKLPRRDLVPHVVHGDFRTGNILYNATGLAAILDWEGVHVSEAEEDLAWYCVKVWRFNRPDREAGGIAGREEWFRAYEQASRRTVDRARLHVWEVLMNLRWAIICMMQSKQHLDGWMDSHEHAVIGRRAADAELEAMRLVGVV